MNENETNVRKDAIRTLEGMLERSVNAWMRFSPGNSQYSLLNNRTRALRIAADILSCEMSGNEILTMHSKDDLRMALAPLRSLISKSEKARRKIDPQRWQYKMLSANLDALHLALRPLIGIDLE